MVEIPPLAGLSDEELDALRSILNMGKSAGLYEQSKFIGEGRDIRNFLVGKGSVRVNWRLVADLYHFTLGDLRKRAASDPQHRDIVTKIDDLRRHAIDSGRHERDMSLFMESDVIEGEIADWNAGKENLGVFVVYRLRSTGEDVLRCAVRLYVNKKIGRTMYESIMGLGPLDTRTSRGFAYQRWGNLYLSGFLSGDLGCEFSAFRPVFDRFSRVGMIITTNTSSLPMFKPCFMIQGCKLKRAARHDGDELLAFNADEPLAAPANKELVDRMVPCALEDLGSEFTKGENWPVQDVLLSAPSYELRAPVATRRVTDVPVRT